MEVPSNDAAKDTHILHKGTGPQNTNSGAGQQSNYTISGGTYVNQYNGQTTVYEGAKTESSRPLNIIPYPRDERFVERAELETLTKRLSNDKTRVAIAGLGGIGKTQLAIEYCYRLKQRSPDTWILWIHASSAERYDQGLRALADDLQIPGREEKDADIHQLVRLWLLNAEKRWLIVLDNVDVAEFLIETQTSSKKSRLQYIPTNGSVLITSRRFKVAEKLVDKQSIIELGLNEDHAVALLQSKLREGDDAVVKELAKALEYMPLAISQAAAYILAKATRCSPDRYLTKLKEDEQSMLRLLETESEELRRDGLEAKNSILKTWQISFEHIYTARQSAANLLSLMSFYDYQGIPEELVRGNVVIVGLEQHSKDDIITEKSKIKKPLKVRLMKIKEKLLKKEKDAIPSTGAAEEGRIAASQEEADTFDGDVSTLQDYAFITRTPGQAVLEMHRLVQLAAQLWLKKKKQYERWEGRSLRRLDALFPWPDYESWVKCRMLYPHTRLLLNKKVEILECSLDLASILYKSADYAWKQGSYVDAEIAARQSLAVLEEQLTDADGRTLNSLNTLALALMEQGRYGEAAKMFERGLKDGKMALGIEDPVILRITHNLTSTYRKQGRLAEAEALQVEVVDIRKRVLGAEHPDTLTSMQNLALTYNKQGRLAEAEALEVKVLDIRKRVLGAEHPDTLSGMHNLAVTYFYQREFQRAQELMSVSSEAKIRRFGASHPDTRISVLWLEDIKEAVDGLETEEVITTTNNLRTASDDQSVANQPTS